RRHARPPLQGGEGDRGAPGRDRPRPVLRPQQPAAQRRRRLGAGQRLRDRRRGPGPHGGGLQRRVAVRQPGRAPGLPAVRAVNDGLARPSRPEDMVVGLELLTQHGIGVVAPFDFALDRELWRWAPDDVSLHLTRLPFVPVEVSLDLARMVSEHETLDAAVQALCAVSPQVISYACTSGSFVGGVAGERAMCAAMVQAGEVPSLTTSGALIDALREIGARRIAVVTPYTKSVTDSLEDYLGEAGITVTGRAYLGLTRHIWKVPYRDVVDMARAAVVGATDALFISCTNLPTYDAIPQLEAELRMPVLSANQVTMWSALRRIGVHAVGPYQGLLLQPEA